MEPSPSFEGIESKFSDLCDDFFNVVHTLREENKTLKSTILELTQELQNKEKLLQSAYKNNTCTKCDCVEGQEEQINSPRKEPGNVVSDSDLSTMTQQIPETTHNDGQQTYEEGGSVVPMSSEVVIHSSFEECQVKQEPVEESNQDILQVETPLMDGDIDIKDEDVDYESRKSNPDGENSMNDHVTMSPLLAPPIINPSSYIQIKIENPCHKSLGNTDKVQNTEPAGEKPSASLSRGSNSKKSQAKRSLAPKKTARGALKSKDRKFESIIEFALTNKDEQGKQGRKYNSNFCGFCPKLMSSVRSMNGHVSRLHLIRLKKNKKRNE